MELWLLRDKLATPNSKEKENGVKVTEPWIFIIVQKEELRRLKFYGLLHVSSGIV